MDANTDTDRDPLPPGWLERLEREVDLERSFAELRGIKHFYAEAWKGRIRWEQSRHDAAWRHFDRAFELAEKSAENIAELARQMYLTAWCVENALAEAATPQQPEPVGESWVPDPPPELLEQYPTVRSAILVRKGVDALTHLHLGQYNDAADLYQELLEEDASAFWHMGVAACEHNLDRKQQARRGLEAAALAVSAEERTLLRARGAATLAGIWAYLGEEGEAAGWREFLSRLGCGDGSLTCFLRRADRIVERCRKLERLLVF